MLRDYRPEDGPWIAERHGVLYHHEFGWDLGPFLLAVGGAIALLLLFQLTASRTRKRW